MGRLVLRRRIGESLSIGDKINIQVLSDDGSGRQARTVRFEIGEDVRVDVTKEGRHVKFVIVAPESLTILRDELTKRPEIASLGKPRTEPGPLD